MMVIDALNKSGIEVQLGILTVAGNNLTVEKIDAKEI
jgi:hypothetical protein